MTATNPEKRMSACPEISARSRSSTSLYSCSSARSAIRPIFAFCLASVMYSTFSLRSLRSASPVVSGRATMLIVLRTPWANTSECRKCGGTSMRGHSLIHSTVE